MKTTTWIGCLTLVLFVLGCGSGSGSRSEKSTDRGKASETGGPRDWGSKSSGSSSGSKSEGSSAASGDGGTSRDKPALDDSLAGVEKSSKPKKQNPSLDREESSGILTAGSYDDNSNIKFFRSFVTRTGQSASLGELPGQMQGHRLMLIVKDSEGNPVGDAAVKLTVAGTSTAELRTRSDGRVVFLSTIDHFLSDEDFTVTVTPPNASPPVTQTVAKGTDRWEMKLPKVVSTLPQNLDLLLVIDTTASMGDELRFLQEEIKNIVAQVQKKFPHVNQNFGLILYRDLKDEYVTRVHPFTPSLDEFRNVLGKQSTGGGGDTPEAMDRALADAADRMQWRGKDTARVAFLIADAPPHTKDFPATLKSVETLRKNGVSVYPLACSGYDKDCEIVMRSIALLTGTRFLFLTDDSGVGGSHAEPNIPYYHVEKLDRLLIRTITSELAGKVLAPEKHEIIRTVGNPPKE